MTTSKGMVFDIKRFAVHDGQGIRTTLFLKGCPLRCVWCQNPEGISGQRNLLFRQSLCIRCDTCLSFCRQGGIEKGEDGLVVHREIEEEWDAIVHACPTRAFRWDAKEYTVEELVEEAKKDLPFFRYGGGVTISGGEPFVQFDFLLKVLKELKQEGIHTAIETTLCAPWQQVEQVLPLLDQIYCDYKIADPDRHQEATGQSNKQIRENLRRLLESEHGKKVTVRTPLIPGWTATEENIAAIAKDLCQWDSNIRYELLNYNPLASSKYLSLGQPFLMKNETGRYTKEEMKSFRNVAKKEGIQTIVEE